MNPDLLQNLYALYLRFPLICTDSRNIKPGSIFFSLKGEKFNANEFAAGALEKGSRYAVIDEEKYRKDERYILVSDALKALQELAAHHRSRLSIPILAITGSNGKTTTKELVSAVLKTKYNIAFTQGNLNNHIGVPLTLLSVLPQHELAVIEMGANHPGEIAFLCSLAKPTHGIITNIGKAHLEGFGSLEGVIKTKSELYASLRLSKGTALVNADDELLMGLASSLSKVTYGTKNADITGELIRTDPYVTFTWRKKGVSALSNHAAEVNTRIIGKYNFPNILASVCAGMLFDVAPEKIKTALEEYVPSLNRSQLIKKDSITIILDAYNANPGSMQAALENFSGMNTGKKALILGDMLELGNAAEIEHRQVLNLIRQGFDDIILVGPVFCAVNDLAGATCFPDQEKAGEWLGRKSFRDHTILIKGSRGMGLEKLLAYIRE